MRNIILPIPDTELLKKIFKIELNLVEFKYIIETYANSLIDKIDFNSSD